MTSHGSDLAELAALGSEGLQIFGGLLDRAIQEATEQRKSRENRKNGLILHALVREGVIMESNKSPLLAPAGVSLKVLAGDGIEVRVRGVGIPLRLAARPQLTRQAEPHLDDGWENIRALFPRPTGHVRLFYSIAKGRLGRLSLTRTATDPDFYYRDCQILEEISIAPLALLSPRTPVVPAGTANDADDLAGLVRPKNHHNLHDEESTTDVDVSRGATEAG